MIRETASTNWLPTTMSSKTTKRSARLSVRSDPKGLRDKAILHLDFDLALWRAGVVSFDISDVNIEGGTFRVLGTGRLQKDALSVPVRTKNILAV